MISGKLIKLILVVLLQIKKTRLSRLVSILFIASAFLNPKNDLPQAPRERVGVQKPPIVELQMLSNANKKLKRNLRVKKKLSDTCSEEEIALSKKFQADVETLRVLYDQKQNEFIKKGSYSEELDAETLNQHNLLYKAFEKNILLLETQMAEKIKLLDKADK